VEAVPRAAGARDVGADRRGGAKDSSPGHKTPAANPGWVVAVGASAGGIPPLKQFLGGLPAGFPAPVLVVLHLDPARPSHIAALLARDCRLPVQDAVEGPLRPGVVHVAQSDKHLVVESGRIRLSSSAKVRFSRPSIDLLFKSVAEAYGDHAIAILLSGSGSDGSDGAVGVKENEGTVLAQERATAQHPDMPAAAVRTGAVDAELPIDQIAPFVARVVAGDIPPIHHRGWDEVLALLKERSGTDFRAYKSTTLHRRLARRLLATNQPDLDGYLRVLREDDGELTRLHDAFLIKVSSFFRDPTAWEALREAVAKPLAKQAATTGQVRAWSAGCATGEEAYSLAMLLLEALPRELHDAVKVFATDLDEQALEVARRGLYDEAQLRPLTEAQRKRYFDPEGALFRVKKDVRNRVIFGRHDLTKDPPIASLDLAACRNVLIYFGPEQKRALLGRLSYAVRPGGFLFMGRSESPLELEEGVFETVAARERIYRKPLMQSTSAPRGPAAAPQRNHQELRAAVAEGAREVRTQEAFHHLLLQSANVLLVLVDRERRVALWNRLAERFFGVKAEQAIGRPVFEVVEGLSGDTLTEGMKRCLAEAGPVTLRAIPLRRAGDAPRFLDLDFVALPARGDLLLLGTDVTARREAEARQQDLTQQLRKALDDAARANESLQAANEELETLNEELQSTTEEQQTLNEELQSSNEELSTLNDELRKRTEESERLSVYLQGILDASRDSLFVCDDAGHVTFWSKTAVKAFRLSAGQAVRMDLFAALPALDTLEVRGALQRALRGEEATVEVSLESAGLGVYHFAFAPIADARQTVRGFAGFVVNVADVTERAHREDELRQSEVLFRSVIETAHDPMLLVKSSGEVVLGNGAAEAWFGSRGRQGAPLRDLLEDPDRIVWSDLTEPGAKVALDRLWVRTALGRLGCSVVFSVVGLEEPPLLLVAFRDLTERQRYEAALEEKAAALTAYNRLVTHDINNLATALGMQMDLASHGQGISGDMRKKLRASQGVLERMVALVRNVQALNELDAPPKPATVDGSKALEAAFGLVALAWPNRGANLVNRSDKGLLVQAGPMLTQVFFNLISNAVRFNPSPQPTVEVSSADSSLHGAAAVTWSVADDGPGMPPEVVTRLTGPMESPLAGGHGLGLFIVRAFVESWGGTVACEAGPKGQGTVVRVTLPTSG
jgi:two-component system CheB/CheR fusion protein